MAKELDFDELDRAVSSLMGSMQKGETSAPSNEPAPVEIPTTTPSPAASPAPASAPAASEKPVTPAPVQVESSSPTPAPAQRRGGRFMDMVHPSADMKPRSVTLPSREGIAITPRPSVASEAPKSDSSTEVPSPAPTHDVMPDPISMAEATTPKPTAAEPKLEVSPAPATEEKDEGMSPSDSPFLPHAKVEKRPLGNEPPTKTDQKNSLPIELPTGKSDDTAESDYPPTQALPAELDNDLVTIESKELTTHAPAPAKEVKEAKDETPAQTPSGPTSITQQYKEQPSSGDSDHAPIYDAEQIPQPLAHPPKKKAGWLWVIWVVLLLVLGAGGAVLLYATGIIP